MSKQDTAAMGEIRSILSLYGFAPTVDFLERVRIYVNLLARWNSRVSLTTISELPEVARVHFGESLFATTAVPFSGRLADVGSGAGFPGLPLAMALPNLDVTLIESNHKKAAFLSEVVRELMLSNVIVRREHSENMNPEDKFDFITGRAIGAYSTFLKWAKERLVDPRSRVLLWLGTNEVDEVSKLGDWHWESLKIPRTDRRYIVVGSPLL